jgi:hypothetical protein
MIGSVPAAVGIHERDKRSGGNAEEGGPKSTGAKDRNRTIETSVIVVS